MKKLLLVFQLSGLFGLVMAQNPNPDINSSVVTPVFTTNPVSDINIRAEQNVPMKDRVFSLVGTAFFKGDGATIPYWDYDIDFTYDGKSGNEFYYKLNRQELLENGEFKVRENHAWVLPSFGYNELTIISPDNFGWVGYNIKALDRKVYDITFIVDSLNNHYSLSLQYSQPLKIKAVINKASSAPVIDGLVDAVWSNALTFNIDQSVVGTTPTISTPGPSTWKGLWNDNGIFILLTINDDEFLPAYAGNKPTEVWQYDKPEIYFDVNSVLADGVGASVPNSGHIQIAPDIIYGQTGGTLVTDGWGVKNAFRVSNPTYVAEYFIPFSRLVDKNGNMVSKTATMGFDVTVIDRDSEAGFRQRAVWTNYGLTAESWLTMDDCGTILLVGPGANILVNGITVSGAGNATTITTEAGTLQMSALISPADANNKTVTWSVTNQTGKAIISNNGLLTAQEDGTVIVTATANDGSGISGSKTITISNQYISFADGSIIKDGGFETNGPIGGFWETWTNFAGTPQVTGSTSVEDGVCKMITTNPGEAYFLQVKQREWLAYNDTSYNLTFTAWSDVNRTFIIDMEDINFNFNRFGASTDPEAINRRSEWIVPLTASPTTFTFHVTMDQIRAATNFQLNILTGNALGTVYIDNISLVSVGYKPLGNGPPLAGTAASNKTICSGTGTSLTLTDYAGIIQWQKSPDGTSNWTDVLNGTGSKTPYFTTAPLSASTWFRAAVSKPDFPDAYSNVIKVTVNPLPDRPGTMSGLSSVCLGKKTVSYSVPVTPNASSYVWSLPTGATGASTSRTIFVNYVAGSVSGIISVKGRNTCGDGPPSSKNVTVGKPYSGEEICMVTVDLETGKNMVVWEKTHNVGTASFNVYREKIDKAGEYDLIGNVNYNDITQFVDLNSMPENRQYLYKISTIDTCGNESALSKWHKTLFLQYVGTTSGVNLNWQEYQIENGTVDFTGYAIFKGSDSTKLSFFTTLSSSLKAYTDSDATALTNKTFYRIGGVKPSPCDPAEIGNKKASSGPYVHSLSNLEDNRLSGTGINNPMAGGLNLTVYPSPFRDNTTINYTLFKPTLVKIEVFNIVGEKIGLLLHQSQSPGNHHIEMKASDVNFINGLYYLRIVADEQVFVRKVILEK